MAAHLGLGSNALVDTVEELEAVREGDWHAGVNLLITVGGDGTIPQNGAYCSSEAGSHSGHKHGAVWFLDRTPR